MQITFKQKFIHANSPDPVAFQEERGRNFQKLLILISCSDRNKWLSTGFNCGTLIESYKQAYGLTSQQFQTLLALLSNIVFKQKGLSTQTKVVILRLINSLTQFQIEITKNFKISNFQLLELISTLATQGFAGSLRSTDVVIEQICKYIRYFSRFGEQVVEEALKISIQYTDIRYLVLFLRSIKSQKCAIILLTQLFSDNNLWERDCFWFYIVSEIIKKFQRIDFSGYYQTIMQQVIKAFTTIIEGSSQQGLKKITNADSFLHVQSVIKSVSYIMAYLMLPCTSSQHFFIKSCIQRLFCLVSSSLDHINPPQYLNDMMGFIKVFVRAYLVRYRKERGLFILINQDSIQDYHLPNNTDLFIDSSSEQFFDSFWAEIIPKIIYLQDSEECKPAKIIVELCMYRPQKFLRLSLQSILDVVSRDDFSLISFHGTKITLLFLQQYVILDKPEYLSIYIQCCCKLIGMVQNLGVPDNIDLIELVFRTFLYLNQQQINYTQVQSLIDDSISLLLSNLDSMSIGLEGSEADQAELYIDFGNIFFPFLLRLDSAQLQLFSQKFLFRLVNQIPEHREAYTLITITLGYMNQKFAGKVFKHIFKQLLGNEEELKCSQIKPHQWQFLKPVKGCIMIKNEHALKWYSILIQCIFQYHPKNVIACWEDIEKIINLLISKWDDNNYLELGLDIIYNLLLCLTKKHLGWEQFVKASNGTYPSLQLDWEPLLPETKQLISYIFNQYFTNIEQYLKKKYNSALINDKKQPTVLSDFSSFIEQRHKEGTIRIKKRSLKLVDFILLPEHIDPEIADQKKIIYRALSLQYTVLSVLMFRVPFHPEIQHIGGQFVEEQYRNLRPRSCKYLEWVLQLLGHMGLMSQEAFVKLFNYFWRESHDELCYTSSIIATNEKISPYYYPQLHRKKELLRSPFLIVNEAYLTHMIRLQFLLLSEPTAYLNNPQYLQTNFILGFNPTYDSTIHSYFPTHVHVHQYHRQILAICRYHLDPLNPKSYLYRFLRETDLSFRQRLLAAIKLLILGIKRLLNIFGDVCCMQDEFIRNTVFQIISLYRIMPKKAQKTLIHEVIYVLLVFSFDPVCLSTEPQYSLTKYWNFRIQNNPQMKNYQIVSVMQTPYLGNVAIQVNRIKNQKLQNHKMQAFRSKSLNDSMLGQLERAVSYLINKIQQNLLNIEKDVGVYLLLLMYYSNSLDIKNPLISQLIQLLFKLCQINSTEIFDMSKSAFFHLINRFNYSLRKQSVIENTPVKRNWDQFLRLKHYGGTCINYQLLKSEKMDENFYPSKELKTYTYFHLANVTSLNFENEQSLLSVFDDEDGFYQFMKNCIRDSELKQNDQLAESIAVSEEDFKSISASAHKLFHFVWDYNPNKACLFMEILERYSASPLNFYNRFFRKCLRIGGQKAEKICYNLVKRLRQGEAQQIRLSLYISCQLILKNPTYEKNKYYIDYLQECSKQNFDFVLMGLYSIFTSNFVIAQKVYTIILQALRPLKGACRMRHLQLLNIYMIAQGRLSRDAARQGASYFLKGITQGSDQISETVVSMITECFVQSINLKQIQNWVIEPLEELVQTKKIYFLNEYVGYNNQQLLVGLLTQLIKKAKQQEVIESKKLRVCSQIVGKILASITIYRFNDYFYQLLKDLIFFVLERPAPHENDALTSDQLVIAQLYDSEYPQEIYRDLLDHLLIMAERTPYVVKKKLSFLQGLVIHRSFRLNKVDLPPLLSLNEKQITLDYIITISTIARLMKFEQITVEVQRIMGLAHRKKHETYKLIALLMATGVRQFQWKQDIVRDLIKHKKDKLVKECISEWWKGKSPQSSQDRRIAQLVRNFQNPYSYFA